MAAGFITSLILDIVDKCGCNCGCDVVSETLETSTFFEDHDFLAACVFC